MEKSKKTILVVASHPDDEVLGCGGTMARHAALGDEVHVFLLGEGLTSRDPARNAKARQKDLNSLQRAALAAGEVLGVKTTFFESLPDNRFDSLDFLDLVKRIEEAKSKIQPDIVYTHHAGDLNIDHRLTCQATVTAFRPLPGEKVQAIYSFEVNSSTEWQIPQAGTTFMPNTFVNIQDFLEQKLKALACYETELRPFPHPRSLKGVEILARYAGMQAGYEAAERFVTLRSIWK